MRDVFISYSSKDRSFVDDLCHHLRRANVTFWLDRVEIGPGDYLRQKVNAGLSQAEYILAIISPNSMASEWVRVEIDAAMMRELSSKKVTVIPLLVGDVKHSDLPPDLQGKSYLDFRDGGLDNTSELKKLIDFLRPDLRRRKELIAELRSGLVGVARPELKLREFALSGRDQTVQQAAITGLAAIGAPTSVAPIAERLLDDWGLNTINHAIRQLSKLGAEGLAGLAGATFWDDRLTGEIYSILLQKLAAENAFMNYVEKQSTGGKISLLSMSVSLTNYAPPLVAAAARFSAQHWFEGADVPFFLPKLPPSEVEADKATLDASLPGYTEMISRRLARRGNSGDATSLSGLTSVYEINSTLFRRI
ncbi:toll/interleukin-1 receptor domain-containing protein [Bradyrhizobium sp. SZCCHNS3004]|uniref:toll/interleukin-1 receptor domain-containing protein n=1 Tax=Bradyrhizobium sp. SZCCHNS3004 TaxID=3057312 RepID=UPI002916854B|nr:toll/interleukin-1 receptor domain-containing protein [Bradyrhizobium sp. SZCCHNS3004]